MTIEPPKTELRRHRRKYAAGELGEDKSFYFRGPGGKLNLRAHNMNMFAQLAEGVASNPTFVRRLLVPLIQAGLVRSTMGRDGGVGLSVDAAAITLGEIYKATMGDKRLWTGRSDIPHRCLVSCNVERFFENLAS